MKAGRYISSILNAASGVTNLVSSRIYPVMIAQNAAYPAVSYSCSYVPLDPSKTRVETAYKCRATIVAWAETYSACESIDLAINTALNFVEGTAAGVTVTGCEYKGSDDGMDDKNEYYFRAAVYEIVVNR